MILRRYSVFVKHLILINLFFFSKFALAHLEEFRCDELISSSPSSPHGNSVRTFEFINPRNNRRGVSCASLVNNGNTLLMYLEEETPHTRKQAIGRAQLQSPSPPGTHIYTGVIHVSKNIPDEHEDLFDLDDASFTISIAIDSGLASFSIKPSTSPDNIVYIWQPRDSVPNWSMHVDIPGSCGIKAYSINDPIPKNPKDRTGIVCVLEESPSNLKFYSLGWKKSRKFVNFGSLRLASPNFLNIYTGLIHEMPFPSQEPSTMPPFKETSTITAVRSTNSQTSFMIYGDLQEEWHDIQHQVDPHFLPRYPLIPISPQTDFSSDLRQIYGLSSFNHCKRH